MKKKILFITNEFPSKTSSTSSAAEIVINFLKNDYEVFCLAITGEDVDGVKVFSLNENKVKINNIFLKLQLIATAPIYPITRPLLLKKMQDFGLNICKKYNIDLIIGVCFPVESVAVGHYIKKNIPSIKFIPYFIDGYACGILPNYLPKKYSHSRKNNYEKNIISNSELVIRMEASKNYYDQMNNVFTENTKYLNPAFLHKPDYHIEDTQIEMHEKEYINILYVGYIFLPDRNPEYLIDALSNLSNVCLIFIGKNEAKNIILNKQKGFAGKIKVYDYISRKNLEDIMQKADFFLNMGVSNNNAISGKIFDYISYGKPIISIYHDDDDASIVHLNKYEYACLINREQIKINDAKKILKAFLYTNVGKKMEYSEIFNIFNSSSPEAFKKIIDDVWEEKNV